MQSENRIFDDASKIVCKIIKTFCKMTRKRAETMPDKSPHNKNDDEVKAKEA